MPIKRPKKTKKKGKSKNGKDEWDLDGGVHIISTLESKEPAVKNRSRTQERDEWKRRGAMKVALRKQVKDSVKRVTKKMKFSDFLLNSDKSDNEIKVVEKKAKVRKEDILNPLSAMERLRMFIEEERNGFDSTTHDSNEVVILKETKPPVISNKNSDVDILLPIDGDQISSQKNGIREVESVIKFQWNHHWFFGSGGKMESEDIVEKFMLMKSLETANKSTSSKLYGRLHPAISSYYLNLAHQKRTMRSFCEQFNIPKPWESFQECNPQQLEQPQYQSKGSAVARQLLPFLGSFADMYLEVHRSGVDDERIGGGDGKVEEECDELSEEEQVLEAALFHIITHTVQSRSVYLYAYCA